MNKSKSASSFYLKIQGRVLGPFTVQNLHQMVKSGQVSRVHMLSEDKVDWFRASEIPELFEGIGGGREQRGAAGNSTAGGSSTGAGSAVAQAADSSRSATIPQGSTAGGGNQAIWYYALGGQQAGPVEFKHLVNLIQGGKLLGDDLVWKESWADWRVVTSVPELARLIPDELSQLEVETRTSEKTSRGRDSSGDLQAIAQTIRLGNPWAFFLCICFYVFSALQIITGLAGVAMAGRLGTSIGQGIIVMLIGGVYLTANLFFNGYINWTSQFARTQNLADLNRGLVWLRRLWLLLGILTIFFLMFLVIFLVIAISAGEFALRQSLMDE